MHNMRGTYAGISYHRPKPNKTITFLPLLFSQYAATVLNLYGGKILEELCIPCLYSQLWT